MFAPSDFVGVFNQTLETAYPSIVIEGEVAELRIRKQKWVYFSLQDNYARVQFFGAIHTMQHPVEDGMILRVKGVPRLHSRYGFSVQVHYIQPVGEGSIKKAADAVMKKLQNEGLFDDVKKKPISLPLATMALITSVNSAAYHDFLKIYSERWGGTNIDVYDVHVQGERALDEIVRTLEWCNSNTTPTYDAIILTRGGGSPEELAVFNTEQVTRAVAASTCPVVVAIGHEIDVCLAELAADVRASTPTDAATVLSLHQKDEQAQLIRFRHIFQDAIVGQIQSAHEELLAFRKASEQGLQQAYYRAVQATQYAKKLLQALNPYAPLSRGYALLRTNDGKIIRSGTELAQRQDVMIELHDVTAKALIQSIHAASPRARTRSNNME